MHKLTFSDYANPVRFGQIKCEGYFYYRGQQWKRTRGRFAVPVRLIGCGGYEVYFDISTEVKLCKD